MAQYHTDGKGASCASGGTPSEPAGRGSRDEFLHGPALGSLFVAGAVLALGWLVLVSPGEQVDELGLAITAGVTLALGAVLVLASRRMPDFSHHERPDGAGYPSGLQGDEISLESRILAVADAYEAMTADRPYRAAIELGVGQPRTSSIPPLNEE